MANNEDHARNYSHVSSTFRNGRKVTSRKPWITSDHNEAIQLGWTNNTNGEYTMNYNGDDYRMVISAR